MVVPTELPSEGEWPDVSLCSGALVPSVTTRLRGCGAALPAAYRCHTGLGQEGASQGCLQLSLLAVQERVGPAHSASKARSGGLLAPRDPQSSRRGQQGALATSAQAGSQAMTPSGGKWLKNGCKSKCH